MLQFKSLLAFINIVFLTKNISCQTLPLNNRERGTTLSQTRRNVASILTDIFGQISQNAVISPPLTEGTTTVQERLTSVRSIDEEIEGASSATRRAILNEPFLIREKNVIQFEGDIVMDPTEYREMERSRILELSQGTQTGSVQTQVNLINGNTGQTRGVLNDLRNNTGQRQRVRRKKRAARRNRRKLWPNGIVNIRIASSGFSRTDKNRIAAAMNHISEETCVCFRIMNRGDFSREPHVRIVNGDGCSSFVGMSLRNQGGSRSQDLTLSSGCRNTRIATHELLHALGLFHEQSRPDRNRFVDIRRRNVIRGKRRNFNRRSRVVVDSRDIPYDYRSIMHYGNTAFSRNGQYTIIPRPESNRRQYLNVIGKATRMSRNDAVVLNRMYGCQTPRPNRPRCSQYPYRFP